VPRRLAAAAIRRLAIPLTIRSQLTATRAIAPDADLYHGMAYMGIPIALDLARRHDARVVYDARDIYVDAANLARMRGPIRTLIARAERRWARTADRVITVNRPYAEIMARRWSVPLPLIVMNCSYRTQPSEPPPRRFHERLGLDSGTRVVLYQGGFSPHRGIEQLLEAIAEIPGAVLVLLGYGALQDELERRAAEPSLAGLVHLLPAVPPTELLDWVASADVVVMPIQPSTLNHRYTTPNKLFEAMAVGVPVVASDLPGMASIVRETEAGLLVDPTRPADIAAACRTLLAASPEEAAARRTRILDAAHVTYNWERQARVLLDEYGRLTGKPW
jgi:glycosyltransferase involved in cell wall biosynthesis